MSLPAPTFGNGLTVIGIDNILLTAPQELIATTFKFPEVAVEEKFKFTEEPLPFTITPVPVYAHE